MGCNGGAPPCAPGSGVLRAGDRLSWIVVVRHPLAQEAHCPSAALSEAWAPHGVTRRLTSIAAKTNGLLNNTTSDTLRVQSLRTQCTEIIRSGSVVHVMIGDERQQSAAVNRIKAHSKQSDAGFFFLRHTFLSLYNHRTNGGALMWGKD